MPTFNTIDEALKDFDQNVVTHGHVLMAGKELIMKDVTENIKSFLSLVWQSALHKGYEEESMNCHNHCKEAVEARNRELAEKVKELRKQWSKEFIENGSDISEGNIDAIDKILSLINK